MEAATQTGRAPLVSSIYSGWYDAPNGKRYFGRGVVSEVGITHDGSTYVKVEPQLVRDTLPSKRYRFSDPISLEDMPFNQYPLDPTVLVREAREFNIPSPQRFLLRKPGLGPGDIGPGCYMSSRGLDHAGMGKIVSVRPGTEVEGDAHYGYYDIEPAQVPSAGGFFAWEGLTNVSIADEDLPRSPYSGSAETQRRLNPERPRREVHTNLVRHWYGKLPAINWGVEVSKTRQPPLGTECTGAYIAPDGQWFAGVGKIVTIGFIRQVGGITRWYVYVEPTGKTGGDYDFFHPITREWMDELPSNPIPGVQCSIAQRMLLKTLRWRNLPLIRCQPNIGEEYHGRYCPPKAPKRDVYVGVGKVVKTGVDNNKIWVEVVPIPSKRDELNYMFWDPWSGKKMPSQYWPTE
ncbi:uncharacterized protein DSM5745_03722 [Aspergillus mulundensis]|uniref:Uncharacterized protein n=1 Tax=Aspergillus mulundensis TaxID=1810919 RepID=A0A3D8SL94_9EURO|nr:hypothetical protein DSM5745_03722 [Aspergillus mulundensis]RDW87080.1 hypothetical protein DSM5745_03722 [Aspergillus mulundensis]